MNEMILLDYSRIQNTWARDCRGPGLAGQQERLEDWTRETDLSSVLLAWPPPAAWWGQRGEALLGSGRESWGVLGNLSAGRAGRQTGVLSYWWLRQNLGHTDSVWRDETRSSGRAVCLTRMSEFRRRRSFHEAPLSIVIFMLRQLSGGLARANCEGDCRKYSVVLWLRLSWSWYPSSLTETEDRP